MQTSSRLLAAAARQYDTVVVGGGIVGAATARQLKLEKPHLKVALVEKEKALAQHQSGHNSGVLHAGIYYEPGSLKAKLCVQGIDLMYEYLDKKKIPYKKCGKLVVAVDDTEVTRLSNLYERAQKNKCHRIELVDAKRIREIQPSCRGLKAIWSPHTGIVDYAVVAKQFGKDFQETGGEILTGHKLNGIKQSQDPKHCIRLDFDAGQAPIATSYLITCAGLYSDRVAGLSGCAPTPKIVPFRGEYLRLKAHKHHLITTNIYPVPDPRFPFLGVHFTPTMKGDIILGPNAVLAFKREGYSYFDFSPTDLLEAVTYSGMRRLMLKYAGYGIGEFYRGINISAQVAQLRRMVPDIQTSDVERGLTGVRAQALDENGKLVDDFIFDGGVGAIGSRVLHVRNAPSPGATSSLAISRMILDKAVEKFQL